MIKPINTRPFAEKTGKSWEDWCAWLDGIGARDMVHKEIARRIVATGEASGWWAQGITVTYEQHIGRRVPGQRHDGVNEVTVSKTLAAPPDDALARWRGAVEDLRDADGVAWAGEPEISATDKWRYWRRSLADGTRVQVTIGEKGAGKTAVAVTHQRLQGQEDIERRRGFWKDLLGAVAVS